MIPGFRTACPNHWPGDVPAVSPSTLTASGEGFHATYAHWCGERWAALWVDGWPYVTELSERAEAA